ncbi:hypothetical protein C8J56DRAFT_719074, partial [Mycena floridula]
KVTTSLPDPGLKRYSKNEASKPEFLGSHRNRSLISGIKQANLQKMIDATVDIGLFWDTFKHFAGKNAPRSEVTAAQLAETFGTRMNPIVPAPSAFDKSLHRLNELAASLIPTHTTDPGEENLLSADFSVEEIEEAKEEIHKHPAKSAK